MTSNFLAVLPEIVVLTGACIILLVDVWLRDERRHVELLADAVHAARRRLRDDPDHATTRRRARVFYNMVVDDLVADVLRFFSFVAVSLVLFYSRTLPAARGLFRGETFVLILFALLGMQVLITANSFLTLYLGLELMSLSLYALVAMQRDEAAPSEAAMKYFVLGALASGFLLYGMSMIYGATGTLEIDKVAQAVLGKQREQDAADRSAWCSSCPAIAFKLGAVPYHMWVPDVYQGAPTAITLLIGTAPEFAAFAMMLRLLAGALQRRRGRLAGHADRAVACCRWRSATSSRSRRPTSSGCSRTRRSRTWATCCMGFLAADVTGYSAAMFYMVAYVLTSLASFGMILLLSRKGFEADRLDDFKGLNARSPWWAFIMLLVMFSLAGHAADDRLLRQASRCCRRR